MRENENADVGTALFGAVIIAMLTAAVIPLMLFIVVPLGLLWIVYKLGLAFANSDAQRERKAQANARRKYNEVMARRPPLPSGDEFVEQLQARLPAGISPAISEQFLKASRALYEGERFHEPIAEPPPVCDSPEGWRYLDYLSAQGAKLVDATALPVFTETLLIALRDIQSHAPNLPKADPAGLTTRLSDVGDCRPMIDDLAWVFFREKATQRNLFADLRRQIDRNLYEASGISYEPKVSTDKLVWPKNYEGKSAPCAYLKDTPLLDIFSARIPFVIPERVRFEHHHIVAGSGHGKTQALQHFIAMDLAKVANQEASIVVIDSQGELIRKISRLKLFAPGNPLANRLVVIDPTDIEFPVTIGLFSVGQDRLKGYSTLDRERLQNSLVELLSFTLGSLMSAEMTAKQGTLFSFLIRAMLAIPDATIHTFRELLEPNGEERFKQHLDTLTGAARLFFETEYSDPKQYGETRRQVLRRLWGILENSAFERMMSSANSKFDLFTEMNAGKVILINADKSLLQQSGTEVFGRFFIAMIAQAAQERRDHALPCFVYIDEFGDYAANADAFITNIFQQARKRNIGMVVAHQTLSDLSGKTADSLAANTSIKFVGGASHADASKLAKEMRTSHDFIHAQRQGSFAAFVRNRTPAAVSLSITLGHMEKMPTMTDQEWDVVRSGMRARYAQLPRQVPEQQPVFEINIDEIDVSPS